MQTLSKKSTRTPSSIPGSPEKPTSGMSNLFKRPSSCGMGVTPYSCSGLKFILHIIIYNIVYIYMYNIIYKQIDRQIYIYIKKIYIIYYNGESYPLRTTCLAMGESSPAIMGVSQYLGLEAAHNGCPKVSTVSRKYHL